MFFLPADPSFSLNESHSAKQVAIKTSPFPQSRLVYRLNLAAAFLLQLSEVPQHNLLVSVVLHLCWSAEFSWIDVLVAMHHSIQECMWKFVVFQREVLRKRAILLYLFYDLLKTNQTNRQKTTHKKKSQSLLAQDQKVKVSGNLNTGKRVLLLLDKSPQK